MGKKKIFILYAPLGMGHVRVAEALKEAFSQYPECSAQTADVLEFTSGVFRSLLPRIYDFTSASFPALYRWAYYYYNDSKKQKFIKEIPKIFLQSKFIERLKEIKPDFIIATHPLPLQLLTLTKEKDMIEIPSANVCTDFGYHPIWLNQDVNYYFVANVEIFEKLVLDGVKKNQVFVTGIPIAKKFSQATRRKSLAPTLLFIGGLLKKNEIEKLYERISKFLSEFQCIIVSGRDKKLEKELEETPLRENYNVRIYGFTPVLHELMAESDLAITKTGGSTVAECLAMELPCAAYKIIPGQEEENLSYLLKHDAAVHAETLDALSEKICGILKNKEKLTEMKNACRALALPSAADTVAQTVQKILS